MKLFVFENSRGMANCYGFVADDIEEVFHFVTAFTDESLKVIGIFELSNSEEREKGFVFSVEE